MPCPTKAFCRFVRAEAHAGTKRVHCFFGAASKYEKSVFPREWMDETILLPFESGVFPVSAHYDELLTTLYGDYMTPPPEGSRDSWHNIHARIVSEEDRA